MLLARQVSFFGAGFKVVFLFDSLEARQKKRISM